MQLASSAELGRMTFLNARSSSKKGLIPLKQSIHRIN